MDPNCITREAIIDIIMNLKDYDYDRCAFYNRDDFTCNVLRIGREEDIFSINIVRQKSPDGDDWDDLHWKLIMSRSFKNTDEIISEEEYSNIIKEMMIFN